MDGPRLYIGIPVGSGMLMLNCAIALQVAMKECAANGWVEPICYYRACDSDIARARNVIIGRFLKSDCTHLLMIDSDISWPPGAVTRMLSHKKDFVAGAYRGKTDEKDVYFIRWPQKKEMEVNPDTGFPLLKVDGIAIGFCLLTRSCVEKLAEPYKDRWMADLVIPDETFPWVIDFDKSEGTRYEEGYSLCRKWRDMGGECWVDPGINLGHMGMKIFESNLVGFLEKMQRISGPVSDVQARIEEAWLRGAPKEAAE